MILALHCSIVGEPPSTLLSEFCCEHLDMMLSVMYAFMGDELLKDQMDGN